MILLMFMSLACQSGPYKVSLEAELPPKSNEEQSEDVTQESDSSEVDSETTDSGEPPDPPFDVIRVEPGTFIMGSPESEEGRHDIETQHEVILTNPFYLAKTELRRSLFLEKMGYDPGQGDGCEGDCPAVQVSWHEFAAFLNILSAEDGFEECFGCEGSGDMIECELLTEDPYSCDGWRFPTESEWEYAARAGETHLYSGSNNANAVAWYHDTANEHPMPVGEKTPNAWGFHDMTGNVFEWCWDLLDTYPEGTVTDPVSTGGDFRNFRGGGWYSGYGVIRVAARYRYGPDYRAPDLGLRPARNAPD